jgi:leucine dehydrogenase
VSIASDLTCGYHGIIAIHDTTLGPSVGGTRLWNYDTEEDALADALRLSRAMTYKAAMAGLEYGGGKSVVIGNPATIDRERVFRAHGRHVESLGGRYIAGEDVNTSPSDMATMARETRHVAGLADRSGDPSPFTAWGVYRGIKACAKYRYGSDSLAGRRIAVQGIGHVGYLLCEHLAREGARLIVADMEPERSDRARRDFDAIMVAPTAIVSTDADVLAPCALGGVIDDASIPALRCDIVAGAANNQLAAPRHSTALQAKGIVYAPDYVINAGGLMTINIDRGVWDQAACHAHVGAIYDTLLELFAASDKQGLPPAAVADELAEQRLEAHERRA